jgi:P pilus assembly chaperone PapD
MFSKKINFKLIFIYLVILFSSLSYSYTASLSTGELYVNSSSKTLTAVISNTKAEPAILEFKMLELLPTQNNLQTFKKESNDFAIYPQKVIVMPNQEKLITIHYKGPKLTQERIFYFKTVPYAPKKVKESDDFINITFLTSYEKIIYLKSKKLKSKLLISAEKIMSTDTQSIAITFENTGNTLYKSKNLNLKIKTTKGSFKVTPQMFTDDYFMIFPNKKVTTTILWPEKIKKEAKIKSVKY